MVNRPRMGRRKIEIKKINDQDARQVCFSKRRAGLFKKASELCILCGAEVAVIVFSLAGKAYTFGHPCVDSVLDRFHRHQTSGPTGPTPGMSGPTHGLVCEYAELQRQLELEKKKGASLAKKTRQEHPGPLGQQQFWWDADLQSLCNYQLEQFLSALLELKAKVDKRAIELTCGQPGGGAHGFAWVPPPATAMKSYGGQDYFMKLMYGDTTPH
ncbi:hypothetical protein AMTRI_Chr01g135860 [Amborella trichopoda]